MLVHPPYVSEREQSHVWVERDTLESYSECTYGELSEATGIVIVSVDDLDADQRKTMYERYTMIAPILAFVDQTGAGHTSSSMTTPQSVTPCLSQ